MSIYVSGSLAFDRIMTFKGNLHDHILMDKLRMISVSFMVDSMDERRGGCAGNIAYSLALLGEKPVLVAAAYTLVSYEPGLLAVITTDILLWVMLSTLLFGVLITCMCAYISINKYLRLSAGDLYYM